MLEIGPVILAGLLIALATATFVAGRALALLLQIGMLRSHRLEAVLGNFFLGTCAFILWFGVASHLGLAAAPAAAVVAALSLGVVLTVMCRCGPARVFGASRPSLPAAAVAVCLVVRIVIYGLPLAEGCSDPCNDSAAYVAMADSLQEAGFGVSRDPESLQPATQLTLSHQRMHHRTGPIFLLAALGAIVPLDSTFDLFPVVMAWGGFLNISGVYLLCRWAGRLTRRDACLAAFIAAVGCNTLDYSSASGFLSQVYGTATLAYFISFLARLRSTLHYSTGSAFLLGACAAMQVSSYPEMAPLFAVPSVVYFARALHCAWIERKCPACVRFMALCAAAFLMVGNIEIVRACRSIGWLGERWSNGFAIPFGLKEYVACGVGNLPWCVDGGSFWEALPPRLTRVILLLAAFSLLCVILSRRRWLLTAGLGAAALAFVASAYFMHDPWSGAVGHTWNMFKTTQWAFPLMAAAWGVGLSTLLRWLPWSGMAAAAAAVFVAWLSWEPHLRYANQSVTNFQSWAGRHATTHDLRRLRQQLAERNVESVYFVQEQDHGWPNQLLALQMHPLPVLDARRADGPGRCTAHTLFVTQGALPFADALGILPGNLHIVDGTRPLLFKCDAPERLENSGERRLLWVNEVPVRLHAFCPQAAEVALEFDIICRTETVAEGRLRISVAGHQVNDIKWSRSDQPVRIRTSLSLPGGVTYLDIVCFQQESPAAADGLLRRVALQEVRLDWPLATAMSSDSRID